MVEDKHVEIDQSASIAQLQPEEPATDAIDITVPEMINQHMTNVQLPRNNLPQSIVDQSGGAFQALEIIHSNTSDAPTTFAFNVDYEAPFCEDLPSLEQNVFLLLFIRIDY